MSTLIESVRTHCKAMIRSLEGSWQIYRQPSLRRFVRFNKAKWARRKRHDPDSVILVGLFGYYPSIYCYSYVINYLARRTGASIETFSFGESTSVITEKTYASFGATTGMTMAAARRFAKKAEK